jgi:hypothetical protein
MPRAAHGRVKAGLEQWDAAANAQRQETVLEDTGMGGGAGEDIQGAGALTSYGVDSWDNLRVGEGTAPDGADFVREAAGPYTVTPEQVVGRDT